MRPFILALVLTLATSAQANILGNMQTFTPNPDSLFFENVHSSKTLNKGTFNIGFYSSYVRNQLSAYDNMTTQHFVNYKDKSFTFDFIAAYGITENFEIFYALPGFLDQEPDSNQFQNNHISSGVNTHRPGLKYDISQSKDGGLAVVASVDFPVTKDDPFTGNEANPIYNLELAYDWRYAKHAFAANVGYRLRDPGSTPPNAYFYPLHDQLIASLGYVAGLNTNQRYHVELYGAYGTKKDPHIDQAHVNALEALLAFKQKLRKGLWGHVGVTGEVLKEGLAPQYRVFLGVNYFFGFKGNEAKPAPVPQEAPPVYQEEPVTRAAMTATPASVEMLEGSSTQIAIDGGTQPVTYRLSRPFGTFYAEEMTYQAPPKAGTVDLIATDANGGEVIVPIVVKALPKASKEMVIENLQFNFNSDILTTKSESILNANIEKLKNKNIKKVIAVGHTDNIGKDEYNLKLSRMRARAVANSLKNGLGLDNTQVDAVGYGESRPISPNNTEKGRQRNRRVELKLYY